MAEHKRRVVTRKNGFPKHRERYPQLVPKRSATFGNWKTSISLEDEFWHEVKWLAYLESEKRGQFISIGRLIKEIDDARLHPSKLSSAIRVHCLNEAKKRAAETRASKHRYAEAYHVS